MQIIALVIATTVALGASGPGRNATNTAQDSTTAAPAPDQPPNEDIRRLLVLGQRVTIADDRGLQVEGRIGALEPDRLTLISRENSTEVPYERIVRIDRPHDGLGNGAPLGVGVGAGLGFAMVLEEELLGLRVRRFLQLRRSAPGRLRLGPGNHRRARGRDR